ncbi:hypothetical protein AAFF_G00324710 [Aldrovandia affinis]|uniref:Uncharacterized protein n=1 Tax=Aldrovandia affinis TaxID=143900 RepID=A0AAD7X1D8_9TELE|nr:hypothetical protein AAFF_G00324710 [Aldrovandia affinis]
MKSRHIFMLGCFCALLFVFWETYQLTLQHVKRQQNSLSLMMRMEQCKKLREKYTSVKSASLGNTTMFSEDMKELFGCPWMTDRTLKENYRVALHSTCNATQGLILTRENTPLGKRIRYDGERKRTRVVDTSLFNMLPESMPWKAEAPLGRCAVIGNGGILKNSSCGSKINDADFVIRLNLASIKFSNDVGVKTNLITANPTQLKRSYPNMKKHGQRLADLMSLYGDPPLLLPAFAFSLCTGISFQVHRALSQRKKKVVFFSPHYLTQLDRYWRRKGQRAARLSTGLMLASVAMEVCEEVHLFGFWPFQFDLSLQKLSHHYYDNVGPRRGAHNMPQEFLQLLRLHSQGVINLHIGKCQ